MPTSLEDRYFGGKRGSARKAYDSMVSQYGQAKGEQVYFATVAKRRKAQPGSHRNGADRGAGLRSAVARKVKR